MRKYAVPLIVLAAVLVFDQALKFYIKLNMQLEDEIIIFNWFRLHFVENPGMAFGMKFGGNFGKLFLTFFRIVAVAFIGYYLSTLVKKQASRGLIVSISLILAGALGNIIDSVFYGVIFTESLGYQEAVFITSPEFAERGGAYGHWFQGKVVDMLYFPMFEGTFPQWFPIWGGEPFLFFRPIFNIADSAITVGVFLIVIFQKRFFKETQKADNTHNDALDDGVTNDETTETASDSPRS